MNRLNRIVVGLLLLILTIGTAQAQTAKKKSTSGLKSRGLVNSYEAGASDGMSIRILLDGDQLTPVSANRVFKSGERIRVEFRNNFEGYAYIVNVTPNGKRRVLFPHGAEIDNKIAANQTYSESLTFDAERGIETLQVIMSRVPIPVLHSAVNKRNGELTDSQSASLARLSIRQQKGPEKTRETDSSETAYTATDDLKIHARGITVVPGKQKGENLVIATPSDKTGKKIGNQEATSFEIRLRHE